MVEQEPRIGEIRKGRDIGRNSGSNSNRSYIWRACIGCGETRWVEYIVHKKQPIHEMCAACKCRSRAIPVKIKDSIPYIGEVRYGRELGKVKHKGDKFIWMPCEICEECRWTPLAKGVVLYRHCSKCAPLTRIKVHEINTTPPVIGEIRMGWEIGKGNIHSKFIYQACKRCGKLRWVEAPHGIARSSTCPCSKSNYDWSDLHELYIVQELTLEEIGQIKNARSCVIHHALKAAGIKTRNWEEAAAIASQKGRFGQKVAFVNSNREGGKRTTEEGYVLVYVSRNHPLFKSMAIKVNKNSKVSRGAILEHRLVMAQYLGRPLTREELVHHKNFIKNDNRIENLEIRDRKHHHPHSHLEERIKQLELRTIQLEADNCRLEKLVQVGVNING